MDYRKIEKERRAQDNLYKKIKPLLVEENVQELEKIKSTTKWDLNKIYNGEYPLNMSIKYRKTLDWLIDNGAEINNNHVPVLHQAFRALDMNLVEYLISKGADVNVKTIAYNGNEGTDVLYGLTYEIKNNPVEKILGFIKYAEENGYSIKKSGGATFKALVYNVVRNSSALIANKEEFNNKNWELINYFVKQGVNVNYNKNNQVFTRNETPLHLAAINDHLEMCEFLVGNGADVEKVNADGNRAYQLALQEGCSQTTSFLKSIEPSHYHDSQFNYNKLEGLGLPKPILDILMSIDRKYKFDKVDESFMITVHGYMGDEEVSEKYSFFDTYNFKSICFADINNAVNLVIKGCSVVAITFPDEVYSMCFYYNLETKMIGIYDVEHDNFDDLAHVNAFLNVLKQC